SSVSRLECDKLRVSVLRRARLVWNSPAVTPGANAAMNKSGHKELRWLLKQMRPLWFLQTVSLICILAGSGLTLAGPLVLKWLIDRVLTTHRMSLLLTGTALYA